MMKVLAVPATNHRNGLNRQLLGYVAQILGEAHQVEIVDLNDYELPLYRQDREAEGGVPALAHELFERIGAADALVVSFAEHNGSYTAAWKNIYDWMSRIDSSVYQGKPVVMLAATPGPRGGAGVLGNATMVAPFFGAELVGQLGIGSFGQRFDADSGTLTDTEIDAELRDLLQKLVAAESAATPT
ncbi:MAG: NAD(P)H-dependent oxidoreductase [Actinomycetota bacterium]